MKGAYRYFPLMVIICLSVSAWFFNLHTYLSFDVLRENHVLIHSYLNSHPSTFLVIYIIAYIVIVGLSIPGATFMTLVGGLLFGQWVGTSAVVVAATIGATVLFISAKLASQELLAKRAGRWTDKMKKGFQENAFNYLLTLRLIPIFPFVAVNLVAALFQIPLKTYILATFIGIIPASFIYVSIGNAMSDVILSTDITPKVILEPKILWSLISLGILSLLPILYKRFKNR